MRVFIGGDVACDCEGEALFGPPSSHAIWRSLAGMFKEADSAAVCLECRSTTAGLAESDCVVIATDPDALDPGLGRRHAKLIVDARRVHVGSDANIIKAQKQT